MANFASASGPSTKVNASNQRGSFWTAVEDIERNISDFDAGDPIKSLRATRCRTSIAPQPDRLTLAEITYTKELNNLFSDINECMYDISGERLECLQMPLPNEPKTEKAQQEDWRSAKSIPVDVSESNKRDTLEDWVVIPSDEEKQKNKELLEFEKQTGVIAANPQLLNKPFRRATPSIAVPKSRYGFSRTSGHRKSWTSAKSSGRLSKSSNVAFGAGRSPQKSAPVTIGASSLDTLLDTETLEKIPTTSTAKRLAPAPARARSSPASHEQIIKARKRILQDENRVSSPVITLTTTNPDKKSTYIISPQARISPKPTPLGSTPNVNKQQNPQNNHNQHTNHDLNGSSSVPTPHTNSMTTTPKKQNITKNQLDTSQRINTLLNTPTPTTTSSFICMGCNKPITGAYLCTGTKYWHKECLTCSCCSKSVTQGEYYIDKQLGTVYCITCGNTEFRCAVCSKAITGQFVNLPGGAVHQECMQSTCPACSLPVVSGSMMNAMGSFWHTKCFSCTACGIQLSSKFAKKNNNVRTPSFVPLDKTIISTICILAYST